MKNNTFINYSIIFLILIVLIFEKKIGISISITLIMVISLIGLYISFEKGNAASKEIAMIAALSAIAAVSRVVFTFIPNVQPLTFIVLISGIVFGVNTGFMVGATSALVSNIFLGQGPWTPWQMFAWGLIGGISGLIGILNPNVNKKHIVPFAFISGFIFDWLMNLWYWSTYIYPLNLKTFLETCIASAWFDTAHAVGNVVFVIIFYDEFKYILNRFKNKIRVTYIKEELK